MTSKDKKDIVLLNESIAHWERMRDGGGGLRPTLGFGPIGTVERPGPSDCALCCQYIDEDCVNCPVSRRTGFTACGNTPYGYAAARWRHLPDKLKPTPEFQAEAQAEIDFLVTVRDDIEKRIRS